MNPRDHEKNLLITGAHMTDELLPYYEKELAFIRQLGAEFSREHPKVAGRLGIGSETIEDPHVSRLVESFAYLNARIQHKLDDDFPELSDALLSVLFPHYQRPIPSMSIAHFVGDEAQLDSCYTIPKDTLLKTESFQEEDCRFSTIYPVELWPVKVASATLIGRPFTTPGAARMQGAASVLKLSLRTFNANIRFNELKPDRLRFYLRGQTQHIHPLYQLLINDCQNVVMALSDTDVSPVKLHQQCIQPVGFGHDEGILPYPEASFLGYRLLTEFFAFPEKFMFVDITGLASKIPATATNQLDLYFYLGSSDVELELNISADNFVLGCSPMVNLFKQRADPIKLDHKQTEYQVIPDVRRPVGYEVYSIDGVRASSSDGRQKEFLPFYGLTHENRENDDHAFWLASRRDAKLHDYHRDEGTDVFIQLVDLHFNPNIPEDLTLILETTCSNRDLPAKLPYNLNHPKIQCVDMTPPCSRVRCLVQPTATIRPPLRNQARWRLISHLNLNYLSITGRNNPVGALQEILRLYDFRESSVTRALIRSIESVQARSISAPLTIDGRATMCRGVEVTIELDDSQLVGSSDFVFATVLEHFFALYCSINSFSRVLVKLKNKEGYLKKCPPRAGERVFL